MCSLFNKKPMGNNNSFRFLTDVAIKYARDITPIMPDKRNVTFYNKNPIIFHVVICIILFFYPGHRVYFSNAFCHYVCTHGSSLVMVTVQYFRAMKRCFVNHLVDSMRPAGKSLFSKCSCCRPGIRHAQKHGIC